MGSEMCIRDREPALQSLSAAHTEASAQAQQKHCGTASAAVAAAASAAAASAPAASAGYCCCCCCCLSPHQSLLRVPRGRPSLARRRGGLALSALSGASGAPSAPSTSLALSLPFAAGGESRASPGSKRLAAPAEAPRTKAAMQYLLLCIAVRAAAAAAGERQQQRRQQQRQRQAAAACAEAPRTQAALAGVGSGPKGTRPCCRVDCYGHDRCEPDLFRSARGRVAEAIPMPAPVASLDHRIASATIVPAKGAMRRRCFHHRKHPPSTTPPLPSDRCQSHWL